ncbi:AAA family ATPase [Amycolatopsis jiangsuensis]|uniref:DNA-binding CsgD family transcriptional regulator n=1 Tax=Amycolatopsis jiangsuensis TaxID=1181879 RepID=A0A840IRL8_9PSEU|nr:LuxR family transcriptional regulator [Amycolatopsis jiangsuensis]MBB4683808.1 DNA-binding CsgD family transcriptional regulator [Amycolatopsis jiangsuensis]
MMIEREEHLAALGAAIARAREAEGQLVVIRGGLGTGRSALLHAAGEEAAARGLQVVRTVATPLEREVDYGVVRLLLDPLLESGWRGELPAEVRLERRFPPAPADGRRGHLVLHELLGLFAKVVREIGPVALLVDDLQWADPASLRWLAYLAHRLGRMRVLLVATLLEGDGGADDVVVGDIVHAAARRISATPLSPAGVRAYLTLRCGEPPEDEFAAACHARTGGLPMLLEALVNAVLGHGLRPVAEVTAELPALWSSPAAARLSRCLRAQPEAVRTVAKAMAALGEATEATVIAEVAGLDLPDFDAVERALRRLGVLEDPAGSGLLRFCGTMTGDLIADQLTADEQDRLHLRAANVYYRHGRPVEQIGRQLLATVAEPEPWAAQVLRTAAGAALAGAEPRTAAQYLRHALAHPGADRAELLVDLAAVERGYDLTAAHRHLHQALGLLRDPVDRAFALCLLPVVVGPRLGPDLRQVRRVFGELRDVPGPDAAEAALRMESRLRYLERGVPGAGAAAAGRLADLGPAPAEGSPAQRELVAVLLHLVALGDAAPRDSVVDLARRVLEREPGSPNQMYSTLPLVVPVLAAADALEGVESWVAAAGGREENPDLPTLVAWTGQALAAQASGYLGPARDRALAVLTAAGPGWLGLTSAVLLVLIGIAVEQRDAALARLVVEHCAPEHEPWLKSLAHGGLAVTEGNHTAAIEYYLDCSHQLGRIGRAYGVLLQVRAKIALLLAATDQPEPAEAVAREEVDRALAWGAPSAVGRALRIRATLLDRDEEAVPMLREAAEVLARSADRLELARVLVLLGERDTGVEAREHAEEGRRLATECAATWLIRPSMEAVEAPDGGPLTATEHRVVELAMAGSRNRDIAELLAVTVRAVEKHLTSSYRKLGISSRTQLAAAMRGHRAG